MSIRATDAALLFLRISGSLLLFSVHGLPKLGHFSHELTVIEDPFNLGAPLTLSFALFAEVVCPLLIALGVMTRLSSVPILILLLVSLVFVHPSWTLEEGQFGWLLLIVFTTLLIAGPGRYAVSSSAPGRRLIFQ